MSLVNVLIKTVEKALKSYGKTEFKTKSAELNKSSKTFLNHNAVDLTRWLKLVKERKLTRDEFSRLVESKEDLLKLGFLKQGGYTLVEVEQTRDEMIREIVKSALTLIIIEE